MQVKNCHVLYHFYVHLLCLECIKHIFMLEFSSNGANVKDEKRAYAYFDDFLRECEGKPI